MYSLTVKFTSHFVVKSIHKYVREEDGEGMVDSGLFHQYLSMQLT